MEQSKREEIDLDDFSLDDFDFGEPILEGKDPSNDRSPVTDFKDGAVKGVKTTLNDSSLYINTIRTALPEGYGNAYDAVTDVKDKGLGLYNEVVQELRPSVRDLKIIGRRAKSAVDSILPDTLSKKLDEWLRDKDVSRDGYRTATNEELREESMSNELGELFKLQAEDKQEERTDNLMRDAVETKRFATNTQQLDGIRKSLSSLVSYQDQITAKYQRKSLELQYRSYYVQRDHLELSKAATADFGTILKNIQKNTSLPETEKVKLSEIASNLTKERLIGVAQDKLAPSLRDFTSSFTKNLTKRIREKTAEFQSAVATFAMGAEQSEMMEDMGESTSNMAGEIAGESGTRWLAEFLGKRLRPWVAKNKNIVAMGNEANFLADNGHLVLKDILEAQKGKRRPGMLGGLVQMLQETALDSLRLRRESRVGWDDISKATEAVAFDNLARKSLVEIIPGWLARLYNVGKQMLGHRDQLETYDHQTNSFMAVDELGKRINDRALPDSIVEYSRGYTQDLRRNLIGDTDDTELNDKVEMMFLKIARDKGYLNTNQISDIEVLKKYGLTDEQARTVSDSAMSRLSLDSTGTVDRTNPEATKLKLDMSRDIDRLKDIMPKPWEILNQYANTGNREALRASGLVFDRDGEDHVDEDAFFRKFLGRMKGETDETTTSEVSSGGRMDGVPNWTRANGYSDSGTTNTTNPEIDRLSDELQGLVQALQSRQDEMSASTITGGLQSIEQTLQDSSVKEDIKEATGVLLEILEVIKSGIDVRSGPTMGETIHGAASYASDKASEFQAKVAELRAKYQGTDYVMRLKALTEEYSGIYQDKKSDFRETADSLWGDLRSAGSRIRTRASKAWEYGKSSANKLWDYAAAPTKRFWGLAQTGLDKGLATGRKLVDTMNKHRARDLYIEGVEDPVITKVGLKTGQYFDAITGKVVRRLSDIKGPIKDAEGNYVLTEAQYRTGLKDFEGNAVELGKGFMNSVVRKGHQVADWARDRFTSAMGLPGVAMNLALDAAKRTLDYIPDVYLPEDLEHPVLIRRTLKAGGYFHADGTVLEHFRDIRSDVKDVHGEVVLEFKDLGRVVDRKGRPIRSMKRRLLDKGKDLLKKAKGAATWAKDTAKSAFNKSKDFAMGALGKGKDFIKYGLSGAPRKGGGGTTVLDGGDTLDKIYNLLVRYFRHKGLKMPGTQLPGVGGRTPGFKSAKDVKPTMAEKASSVKEGILTVAGKAYGKSSDFVKDKMAKAKGSVKSKGGLKKYLGKMLGISEKEAEDRLDDVDGGKRSVSERARDKIDALKERSGSWRNILNSRKKDSTGKGIKAGTGPLKPKKEKESSGFGIGDIIGLLGSAVGALGGLLTVGKGILGGVMGLSGMVKGLFSFFGGSKPDVPDVDLPDSDKKNKPGKNPKPKPGGWKSKLWRGAKFAGRFALKSAMFIGGRALLAAGGAVIGGIATALSVPALAVGAAVAAVGTAGYFTYRYFKNKLTLMQKLRMSQYGVDIDGNKDACVKVAELEAKLEPYANVSKEGTGTLSSGVNWKEILEIFELDPKDQERMGRFNDWFQRRFKPVFFRHYSLMLKYAGGAKLIEAEERVPDEYKYPYAKASLFEDRDIYLVGATPFPDQSIVTGTQVIDEILEEFKDEYEDASKEKTKRVVSKKHADRVSNQIEELEAKDELTNRERMLLRSLKEAKAKQSTKPGQLIDGGTGTPKDLIDRQTARIAELEAKGELSAHEKRTLANLKRLNAKPVVKPDAEVADEISGPLTPKATYGKLTDAKPIDVSDKDFVESLPNARGSGNRQEVAQLIDAVAQKVGVDPVLLSKLAMQASGYDASKRDGTRQGMFQMDLPTWRRLIEQHGAKYGFEPTTQMTNIKAETLMAAHHLKQNLSKLNDGERNDVMVKLSHYMGIDRARRIDGAMDDEKISSLLSPMDKARFHVTDDTTKQEFVESLGNATKEKVADMYVGRTSKAQPQAEVIDVRKQIAQSRQTPESRRNAVAEMQQKREDLETMRRKMLDHNNRARTTELTGEVANILNESLAVHRTSEGLLRTIESHLRMVNERLDSLGEGKGTSLKEDLPPPPPPPTEPPKSRVNSKRQAI